MYSCDNCQVIGLVTGAGPLERYNASGHPERRIAIDILFLHGGHMTQPQGFMVNYKVSFAFAGIGEGEPQVDKWKDLSSGQLRMIFPISSQPQNWLGHIRQRFEASCIQNHNPSVTTISNRANVSRHFFTQNLENPITQTFPPFPDQLRTFLTPIFPLPTAPSELPRYPHTVISQLFNGLPLIV